MLDVELCICGHGHFTGATCWCGCPELIVDDGTDGRVDNSCLGKNSLPNAGEFHYVPPTKGTAPHAST